jgi:D-xylose transport system substrate-binding protein
MKKILWVVFLLVLAAGVAWGAIFFSSKKSSPPNGSALEEKTPILIGFALGALREERWLTDESLFTEYAEQLGAVVIKANSDYDVPTQILQIENLVIQGVKVIVIVAADSKAIAPAIDAAHDAGVKIIAYDRLIENSYVDSYVSFDNVKVGELQAEGVLAVVQKGNFAYIGGAPTDNNAFLVKKGSMSVLDPKIKSGDIKLVLDSFTPNWDPAEAYKTMKNYLDTGKTVDAVIAANDGTAFGVIQALAEKGLAGKVPVSGQDAELSATQRIVQGTQIMTVYKPIEAQAKEAAKLAVAMAKGETPNTTVTTNNGKMDVFSYLLPPVAVTKANMADTVIKDNFHTYEEIYEAPSTLTPR